MLFMRSFQITLPDCNNVSASRWCFLGLIIAKAVAS